MEREQQSLAETIETADARHLHAEFQPVGDDFWLELKKRSARRAHGVIASVKCEQVSIWRNREERDLFKLLEVDVLVASIEVFPEQVSFVADGRKRTHVPAFRIRRGNQTAVVDAMRAGEEGSRVRQQFNAMLKRIYRQLGIIYCAIPRAEVCRQPRRTNAMYVLSHVGDETPESDQILVTEALSRKSPCTIAELEQMVERPYLRSTVFNMALHRHVVLDLDAPSTDLIRASLRRDA